MIFVVFCVVNCGVDAPCVVDTVADDDRCRTAGCGFGGVAIIVAVVVVVEPGFIIGGLGLSGGLPELELRTCKCGFGYGAPLPVVPTLPLDPDAELPAEPGNGAAPVPGVVTAVGRNTNRRRGAGTLADPAATVPLDEVDADDGGRPLPLPPVLNTGGGGKSPGTRRPLAGGEVVNNKAGGY